MDLEDTVPSERSQAQKDPHCATPLTGGPQGRQIHRDRKQMVGPGAGGREGRERVMGTEGQFGKMGKFWRWTVGTAAQRCVFNVTEPRAEQWLK